MPGRSRAGRPRGANLPGAHPATHATPELGTDGKLWHAVRVHRRTPGPTGSGRPRQAPFAKSAFSKWLARERLSAARVAACLGCSQYSVYHWRGGWRLPGLRFAVRIEQLSLGAVPVESWLERPVRARR